MSILHSQLWARPVFRGHRTLVLLVLTGIVALTGLAAPDRAGADTRPPDSTTPATVASDALPTAQIDGVAWTQLVVGSTVYVGGQFTTARPAGAAAGVGTVTRSNLLAYNVTTGVLTAFAPNVNGVVRALAVSPDKSTLYVGGTFTTVNGLSRTRLAAFTVATGAVTNFAPSVNSTVYGIAVTETAVYFGGSFTVVNGSTRSKAAAVNVAGGTNRPWAPAAGTPSGTAVRQVVVSPDRTKVVLGGSFTTMNGHDSVTSGFGGYGLAMLDATSGASLPLPVNSVVRDAGTNAAILSLTGTADGFYGSGYAFAKADGNLEGAFRADWNGNLVWLEDCHGDTYSAFPVGGVVYATGHAHFCGNMGGFPQTSPTWTYQRAIAFQDKVAGTLNADQYAYFNFAGKPKPTLLAWFPDINVGTFTGQSQGAWSVSGNADYVVYGGEFTKVNNKPQQGLVRFARSGVAAQTDGPRLSGASFVPTATRYSSGVRLSWPANHDRDNELLTYKVIRTPALAQPVTLTRRSTFWQRPNMSWFDSTAATTGSYTYRLQAIDPLGNSQTGNTVSVPAATNPAALPILSHYDAAILADSPQNYWPLNESSGTTAADIAGTTARPGKLGTSVTAGTTRPGAISGDANAPTFLGSASSSTIATQTADTAPQTFTEEAWFKTTSTRGGKIIGFGTRASGDSTQSDRQIYLGRSGKLFFGVNPTSFQTINSSAAYNDGRWHQVVATMSPAGMSLYVDGAPVASRTDIYTAWIGTGYWRIGGDYMASWPDAPATGYLSGSVDKVAVYNYPLSSAQVAAHWGMRTT